MPKDVKLVIGSGAGGGLVSWAFTIMTGATFGLDVWSALPLCMILGTAAALVAVYVVTPTDVTKTGKLIGFALLCGFLWKPVLDAGRVVISQRIQAAQTAAEVKTHVSELKSATTPAAVGAKAHDAANGVAELLRSSGRLDNVNLEKHATAQAAEAVNAIAETSTANPVAATLALDDIKKAARESNNPGLANLATQKITMIERSTPRQFAPLIPRPNQ
ncbi:MAG: hypothetical protein M3P29_07885 [Acidobacteriota bacterium]|nr:hypothetical protein [Acidobacteriota bacterium]